MAAAEWGTIDYYIERLSSPTPPLHIDVCDVNLTDEDAFHLADALLASTQTTSSSNDTKEQSNSNSGTTLKKLRLRGSQITSRGFLALAEAIGGVAGATSALEELDLGHTIDISKDVDDFAFGMYLFLSAATKLKSLDLEGCYLGKRAGIALTDVIATLNCSTSLDTLNLRNNALDDDAIKFFASKLQECKVLQRVDLGWNYIGPRGAQALAEDCIASNPASLKHLILFGNPIGDKGARYFAKALKRNTNLMELNLGYNRLSSVGMEALLYAIFDTTSLNALVDSNHTLCYLVRAGCIDDLMRRGCDVDLLFDVDNILRLNEMNSLIKKHSLSELPEWVSGLQVPRLTIEQFKVVIYLSKCFDMRNFLALDKAMIPQALEFVGANFGQEKVFHLLGQWNMPELFLPQNTMQGCQ